MRVSFISLNLSQSRTMLSADTCDTSVQYTRCVFRQKNELNSKREKEVGTLRRNLRWNFSHLLGQESWATHHHTCWVCERNESISGGAARVFSYYRDGSCVAIRWCCIMQVYLPGAFCVVCIIHLSCLCHATVSALSLTLLGMHARSILPRRPYHCPPPLVSCAGHCHWEPTMANLCSFDILCHLCVWCAATSLCLICCTIFGCSSTVPCVRAQCWNTFVLDPGFCSGLWYAATPTTMPCTLLHCDNTMPCTLLHNSASFFGSVVVHLPWDAPCDSGMANLCT